MHVAHELRREVVAAVTRKYPFYGGCMRLSGSKFLAMLAGPSEDFAWATLANRKKILVPLNDFNGRAAYFFGEVDPKITWVCSRLVRPGDVVLDIGANIGLVTFTLSPLVGARGRVHAFEPNPRLVRLLKESVDRNQAENVQIHPFALGDRNSTLVLRIPEKHSGSGSLVRYQGPKAHTKRAETVQVRRLIDILQEGDIGHLRLVKIDVEGFEPQVLEGAKQAFETDRPDAILVEINNVKGNIARHPAIVLLRELDYEFLCVRKSWLRMKLEPFDPERNTYDRNDLLAAPRGRIFDEIAALVGAARS